MIQQGYSQPSFEKVEPSFGHSFTLKRFDNSNPNSERFWHFHPEMELIYISGGTGKRHIGNHMSYYNDGDLILIGPNLPHFGFTHRFSNNKEIVIQWKKDFLGDQVLQIPEMTHITKLLERSAQGLVFLGNTKEIIGARLDDILVMNPYERLIGFLNLLDILAKSDEYETLNAHDVALGINQSESERIDKVYKYIRTNFMDGSIKLETVANLVNMTVPSFCRYFKSRARKTFTEVVNEFKVVHATKLLAETELPISHVCFDSGFNNFSNFNRYFKRITGKSPSEYRKELGGRIISNVE